MTERLLPALLLVGALAIVSASWWGGKGVAARIAALVGGAGRSRAIAGWALGTAITFGLSSVVGLAALGRLDTVLIIPNEFVRAAWSVGLPGDADSGTLWGGAACLGGGAAIGLAILAIRRWRGEGPIGLRYRSPAAARERREIVAATLLAVSAGIGEELFFRLLLPLLFAMLFGWGIAAFVVALALFVALHRHQGWGGMVAVGMVGGALTAIYLFSCALWVAMLLHVLIDVNALVVRPLLSGR